MMLETRYNEWPLTSVKDVEAAEKAFISYLKEDNCNRNDALWMHNCFRVQHASMLPKTKPRILLGTPFDGYFPNVHSYSLFEVADIVSLNISGKRNSNPSSVDCNFNSLFSEILKSLPKGFIPDFYWDNQIEHKHYIPIGIEVAPFPIIASICHNQFHKSVEHVCTLFDAILSVSKEQGNQLRQRFGKKILDLNIPFGLNWATFSGIQPTWEKSIDLFVVFSPSDSVAYQGKRKQIYALVEEFQKKCGNRYTILITENLPEKEYVDLLSKSRITVNVTGVNGPYNYRTVEAMSAGTLLFQYNWEAPYTDNNFSESFIDGKHGIGFTLDNFEEKMLYYLENPDATEKIAREAYHYAKSEYNYKKLFGILVDHVPQIDIDRSSMIKRGLYHHDMIYYYQQNSCIALVGMGCVNEYKVDNWERYNNLLVMISTHFYKSLSHHINELENIPVMYEIGSLDEWSLLEYYYSKAKNSAPKEFVWIVEWNFLLIKIEQNKASQDQMRSLLSEIEKMEPIPFNELSIVFKYYVLHSGYPEYGITAEDLKKDDPKKKLCERALQLNIDLRNSMNDPKRRAKLHLDYAKEALVYFLNNGRSSAG